MRLDLDGLLVQGRAELRKGKAAREGSGPGPAEPQLRRAARTFESILELAPRGHEAPEASLLLGLARSMLDDTEAALAAYSRTYEDYDSFEARHLALLWMGICEAGLGNSARARASYRAYLREFPQRTRETLLVRKRLHEMEIVDLPAPPLPDAETLRGLLGKRGLSSFRGRVVILVFLAAGCSACTRELEHLRSLMRRWRSSEVVFLGIADPEDPSGEECIDDFLSSRGLSFFDVLLDAARKSFPSYRVTNLPAAAVIDRASRIRWRGEPGVFPGPLVESLLGRAL